MGDEVPAAVATVTSTGRAGPGRSGTVTVQVPWLGQVVDAG
jgi:hypothetical protein